MNATEVIARLGIEIAEKQEIIEGLKAELIKAGKEIKKLNEKAKGSETPATKDSDSQI